MTPASKGTSVKKAPAARTAAAAKSGAGAKTSSSKAGTSVSKPSDGRPDAKKDAIRTVSKAAPTSKRAVPATEKASTARKAASATTNAKAAPTAKKTAVAAKKTAPEKSSSASHAAKKAAGSHKTTPTAKGTAPAAKGRVATAARASEAKKAGTRSAKTATAAPAAPSESSTSPVSSGAPAVNGAGAGRTAFAPKPKPAPVRPKTGPYAKDAKFLDEMRESLHDERAIYQEQATSLRAEADSLALEREPGDVQFDEESGEGGTVTVDRERNLALSGQAAMAVEEIDSALTRIDEKTYGYCERCFQPIPKPRLRALPYARLCVACKSGGLSRR
jgi:DnaK suppressor protein